MKYLCPSRDNDAFTHAIAEARGLPVQEIGVLPESKLLTSDSGWLGERKFVANLESMRSRLEGMAETEFHIDLGADVSTLYAAYYLIYARKSVSVTVHFPPLIGGGAGWWQYHELLRRRLAMYVLGRAKNVFVPTIKGCEALQNTYPRCLFEPILQAQPIPQPAELCCTRERKGVAVFADFSDDSNQAGCVMAIVAAHKQDPANEALKNIQLWGGGDEDKARSLTAVLGKNTDINWEINFDPHYDDLANAAKNLRLIILPTINAQYGPTPQLYAAMLGGATLLGVAQGSNVGMLTPGQDAALYLSAEPATFVSGLRGLLASPETMDRLSRNLQAKLDHLTPEVLNPRFLETLGVVELVKG